MLGADAKALGTYGLQPNEPGGAAEPSILLAMPEFRIMEGNPDTMTTGTFS